MNTKTLGLAAIAVIIILGAVVFFFINHPNTPQKELKAPEAKKEVTPSKTFIDYSDPAGFSFSYPDNLSLSNKTSSDTEVVIDPDTYADLQLFSKDKSGSLNLTIANSKYKTIAEWQKGNEIPESIPATEKKLGTLNAYEFKTKDRLMLASLDQGILFTIDMPLIEEPFWNEVYNKVTTDFAFSAPEAATTQTAAASSTGEEVLFEGEEVVE